jgi:putative molybdopterin biosynthesis protein
MGSGNLLTTKEVAELLRVHPKQVYRLLKRGLPAARVGDEWRFDRADVLHWTGAPTVPENPASAVIPQPSVPPLLAANGDCAIELLLELAKSEGGPLLGLVSSDHTSGAELLAQNRVLVAGQHGGASAPPGSKWARLHLMTREVGLASRAHSRQRLLAALVGRRLASRPSTAGVRRRLDRALERAGTDLPSAYRNAVELDSHRAVVLAVASGSAEIGLATHAWASMAGLRFQPLGSEAYDLAIAAEHLGDARVVALCELVQSARLRKQLRDRFGYGVGKTGELRVG